jgi:hypothetical protein
MKIRSNRAYTSLRNVPLHNDLIKIDQLIESRYEYNGGGQTGVQNYITIRNNSIHGVYGRDREAITSDGGTTACEPLKSHTALLNLGPMLSSTQVPIYLYNDTHDGVV